MEENRERYTIWEYLFPSSDPKLTTSMDRQSMRSICYTSLIVSILETILIIAFLIKNHFQFDSDKLNVLYNVIFCAVFSFVIFLISRKMMKNKELSHISSLIFKVFFYLVYTIWGIFSDMRHYVVGDQMLTFHAVQLLAACFIQFEPLISIVLVVAAYSGLFIAAYVTRQAAGIEIFNFILLEILTVVGMCIQYNTQLYLARKEERLKEISHRDALTGLRNRLALEEDAKRIHGTAITAYMIDNDYFKEINDTYGHVIGDEILKETGITLQNLYPEALCYRYGGDEFLVLSLGEGKHNYEGEEYEFIKHNPEGICKINLSIGTAKGQPQSYDELFTLINTADTELYKVKERTHSPEHGGHERRRRK
jgi:diguanylate cyclase (GGDEF)-like protein